ncbi:MAG: hypothetical protein RLO12_18460 [Fulvivirga sp.]|uniref:hypothetical protein n=1 Tax=Fulvivirga sp. TaxID=1931237 RepID=UPI0032FA8EE6
MGQIYDYHKREPHNSWQLKHCEVLLEEAAKYSNTSLVIYAALEARNLLEKTEFDLMLMSTEQTEWETLSLMARGKYGLTKSNSKYKALKYRYQTFSEAITKVILNFELKVYDYKASEILQNKLAEYVHIYTRTPEELKYTSNFIKSGINNVKDTIAFIKSYYVVHENEYLFGILNFSTLSGSMKDEFEKWKSAVSEDTNALYERLKKINDEESGGLKAKLAE